MGENLTKVCKTCGEMLPISSFSSAKRGTHGVRAHCKSCMAKKARARRIRNPERVRAIEKKYRESNPEKVYEKNHRPESEALRRAYADAHPDAMRRYIAAYRRRNTDTLKEKWKAYYMKNHVRELARNHEKRAVRANAEGSYTAADIQARFEWQLGRCLYCGVDLSDGYHIDHWVPLAKGGTNWGENIVLACPPCNLSKKDKWPEDFISSLAVT